MAGNFPRRSLRFVRRLGFRGGVRAAYVLAWGKRSRAASLRSIAFRAAPHPIWVRAASSDIEVFEQVFVHREYDFSRWPEHQAAVDRAYASALDAGRVPVIVDCGANIGCASIWFTLRYPRALLYAVEPEPGNFAILRRNVADYPNVVPIEAAISDRAARTSLRNATGEPWAFRTEEDAQGAIAAVTIPDLLAQRPNGRPLIVKVDIEGHETALFRSNTDWVRSTPLVVLETHDWLFQWPGTADAVFRSLTRTPRDYLVRGENIFSFAHPA